ncbi:TPA: hypothetical protein HFQ00_004740 [Escherichia coli]|nr:hypothetical protein [Salmonella enterica]HAG6521311.1 hypothetical protein [Escherichia coli]
MNYIESKELSLHILSSIKYSVHFNKYEVDEEKDLDGIKYITERNRPDIEIKTFKIKKREPGSYLFLLNTMKDTLKATDLFIIYSKMNEEDEEELTSKLKSFAFKNKAFVVQLTEKGS